MTKQLLRLAMDRLHKSGMTRRGLAADNAKVYLLLETGGGGSGRHVLDLYAGLVAAGWNVHLLLSTTRMDPAFAREVAALPQDHITYLRLRRSPHISDVGQIRRIRRQLKLGGDQVILHAHSTKAAILAWALRGRSMCRVFTPHAYRGMDPKLAGYRAAIIRSAEKLFSGPFESVIAVSQDEVVYATALGVTPDRIHLIPNGVDAVSIRSTAHAGRRERNAETQVLGFLGRLVQQKNPHLFLRVVWELVQRGHDVNAAVVGDGPLLPELKQLADHLQLTSRVEWMGAVPALNQLANMDVLVHTSAYESLPYALLEAIAADIPVVAVDNAGSRAIFGELLPQSIVPQGTAEALAAAVADVLQNGALQQQYRESYQRIMEQFSTRTMVDRTITVYQEALRWKGEQKVPLFAGLLPRLTESFRFSGPLRTTAQGNGRELDRLASVSQTR